METLSNTPAVVRKIVEEKMQADNCDLSPSPDLYLVYIACSRALVCCGHNVLCLDLVFTCSLSDKHVEHRESW